MDAATPSPPGPAVKAEGGSVRPNLDELCQNTRLLIRLRWVAGGSIVGGAVIGSAVFGMSLSTLPLVVIGLCVLLHNLILWRITRGDCRSPDLAWRIAWVQILLDWIAMTALVHFTGGITSPALIYFMIHAALSGTVLVPLYARSLALIAVAAVAALAWAEKAGWLPHIRIAELGLGSDLHQNATYILAVLFFLGTALVIVSELVADKAQRLRQRELHIRQLYEARSTFMRVATHELRAPVAAGLSLMHNVEQGYAGDLTPQQAEIVGRVTRRLEGLRTLVDDMLTLAATQEATIAQVPLEPVNVRDVLEKIVEREQPNADEKQVALEVDLADEAAVVNAGEVGLSVVFGNLLNNAIKYTPSGGHVRLAYHLDRAARTVEIAVSDDGIGIPPAEVPQIFTEFFRASNARSGSIPGSGIGLATVSMLVERYGGSITVESTQGQGSRFAVTLPLLSRAVPTGKPQNTPALYKQPA